MFPSLTSIGFLSPSNGTFLTYKIASVMEERLQSENNSVRVLKMWLLKMSNESSIYRKIETDWMVDIEKKLVRL